MDYASRKHISVCSQEPHYFSGGSSQDVWKDGTITIESENIAPQHPILYNAWEKFTISSFGRGDVSECVSFKNKPKEPEFWMTLVYAYVTHDRGCNSTTIGHVTYTESEGWKIETTKKRI